MNTGKEVEREGEREGEREHFSSQPSPPLPPLFHNSKPQQKARPLNQQYCGGKHNTCDARQEDRKTGKQENRKTGKQNTPPALLPPHTPLRHATTRPPTTALPHPQQTQQHTNRRETRDDTKGTGTMRRGGTQSQHGGQHTPRPAIQQGHHANKRGGRQHTDGEVNNTTALPSPCHPPPQQAPHHPQWPHPPPRRGEGGQRIPHHTTSEERHSPPARCGTPTRNSTRHDRAVLTVCTGSRWHRPHTLGWGRPAAAHPTAIPHGTQTRRMDTIHSSTLTLFTFTHSTINDDQHNQRLFNQQ